jgi:hypothetical protein
VRWISVRNSLLAVGFLVLFVIVVVSYPSFADKDLAVIGVVALLLVAGLVGILLSGKGNQDNRSDAP